MKRIRTRLVALGLATALLPAIPLSLLVRGILERSFAAPLGAATEEALTAGLEESRERLAVEKRAFVAEIRETLTAAGDSLVSMEGPDLDGEKLRATATLAGGSRRAFERPLPPGIRERAEKITDTLGLVRALGADRAAILQSYIAPFVLTYALLLAVAAALGALLARRIARPVEALASAAGRVGAGDLSTRVLVPASGEVGDLVASFNKMVERIAADRTELARLERLAAWRDLARKLAHEIKNPLTPIQLAVHQASDGVRAADDPSAKLLSECREIVDEEIERLRRLVREFSEFARLPEPALEDRVLDEVVRDVARLYGDERVDLDIAGGPIRARFDDAELRRALVNLVDNGFAACREASSSERVRIAASISNGLVRLEVADAGAGIPPENLARLFEPSFTTKKDGMGLGLAIVEGIIRGHGGVISVQSAPARGTTFRLEWPVDGPPAPAPPARKEME